MWNLRRMRLGLVLASVSAVLAAATLAAPRCLA
jgi:hypothetical protein